MHTLSLFLGLLFGLCCFSGLAHHPQHIYANLQQEASHLQLTIEFPWTITEVVRAEHPDLSARVSKKQSQEILENYLATHLQLESQGRALDLIQWKEIPQDHGHSIRLSLQYPTAELEGLVIHNSLFVDYFETAKTQFQVQFADGTYRSFKSNKEHPRLVLEKGEVIDFGSTYPYRWMVSLFLIGMLSFGIKQYNTI
ncbi:MAG: DUF6702 family protein [Bacteroidota bacterium]